MNGLPDRLKGGGVRMFVQALMKNLHEGQPHPMLVAVDVPTLMSQYHTFEGGQAMQALCGEAMAHHLGLYFQLPQTFHYESATNAIHAGLDPAVISFAQAGTVSINGRVFNATDGQEAGGDDPKRQLPKLHMRPVAVMGLVLGSDHREFRTIIRSTLLDLSGINFPTYHAILDRNGRTGARSWVKLWVDPKEARRYQDLHNSMVEHSPTDGYFTAELYEQVDEAGAPVADSKIGVVQFTPRGPSEGRCVFEYLLEILYLVPKD